MTTSLEKLLLVKKHKGFTVIDALLVLAIILIPAFLIWYNYAQTHTHNELACIKQKEREYTYPVMVGKITVILTGKRMECVEWQHK